MASKFKNAEEAMAYLNNLAEVNSPNFKIAVRVTDVWSEALSDEDKHWLRYTEEGRREMWRRMGLAFQLVAKLEKTGSKAK